MDGVILTPLKKIHHPKGDIFHAMRGSDAGYVGFGEAYCSGVKSCQIKGWNRHKQMTLNLIVLIGSVKFVIIDDISKQLNKHNIFEVELSMHNYQRLTIPPRVWVGFQCTSVTDSMVLNIADMEHDPSEIERLDLKDVLYNWESN